MTLQLASAIVSRLGPCQIALEVPGFPGLPTELALLGCDVSGSAAAAVAMEWSDTESQDLPSKLARYGSAEALVMVADRARPAAAEASLFAAGWRRHPGALTQDLLAHLEAGRLPEVTFYERAAPGDVGLLSGQDGASTGALARWVLAAERVRPGDRVLLCGPHADDGRSVVEALSRAAAVEVMEDGADAYDLRGFDVVAAFDASGAWDANVDGYTHLLKLDGRLILGWPETSRHGPDAWAPLEDVLTADFLIESRFAQGPGQAVPQPVPLDDIYRPGWRIVVAAVNPIGGEAERQSYVHPAFGRSEATVADFAAGYDNPWLYRTMVQMGERLTEEAKLARLAEYVAVNARPGSADQGAALAVLGYRILESRAGNVVSTLLGAIATYCDQDGAEPHVVRWRLSLAFLAGRLLEMVGDRAAAKLWYGRASGDDWKRFSNILATKAIGAAFFAGRITLADGEPAAAWTWFQRGVDIALQAAGGDHRQELGTAEGLLSFYLPELAEVIDMGSQCANALANRHLWDRDPGLFWRQVDVKRFGLASWAIDVMRENAWLRQRMAHA